MKIRLDQYLVQHGLIQSRERAKAMIMSGVVFVNEQKVDKAGEMIKDDAKVEVRGLDFSPVKGPEGNIEYLMFVQKSEEPCVLDDAAAEQVVAASHSTLDR